MMTGKQEQILSYIRTQSGAHDGRGPSLKDILEHFKPAGDEGRLELSQQIKQLESEGLIKKDDSRLRN